MKLRRFADFQRLKSGPVDRDVSAITILPGAGGSFADVKHYANTHDPSYIGAAGDIVQTSRAKLSVQAVYNGAHALLALLPVDFLRYSVTINSGSKDTAANVHAVLQWKQVESIKISDNGDLAFALMQNIDALNGIHVQLSVASH